MKNYQPSGVCSLPSLLVMLGITSTAAVGIGWAAHFVGQFFYLIVLFPFLIGLGVSTAVSLGITKTKCRNTTIAALVAIFAGAVTYSSMHLFDYATFKRTSSNAIVVEMSQQGVETDEMISTEQAKQLVDNVLEDETGSTGFIGYMKFMAQKGISISNKGSGGFNIGQTGTWIYWVLEFGAILFLAFGGSSRASEPFCEKCESWYTDGHIGDSSGETEEALITALQSESFADLSSILQPATSLPRITLNGSTCPSCSDADVVINVERISLDSKGKEESTALHSQMVTMEQYTQLRSQFENVVEPA